MASRGKTVQKTHMFVADFETCDADKLYKIDINTGQKIYNQRVWLAGYKNLETMESTTFTTLDEFMEDILSRGDNQNTEYAFHNLKFDGSFIVPYLLTHNYECVNTGKPQSGQFSVLVDSRNYWYSINIQVTKRRRVLLWDSLKLFPTALEYLPELYATPTHKIQEDKYFYESIRPVGHKPTKRELEYFENDLQVPAEALNKHIELYGLRFKKTQASQAFYNFEQSFKAWKLRFPALTTEQDSLIRPAYWGGISLVPKGKEGKDFHYLSILDINSSYPDKAANCKLPYGNCVLEAGEGHHPDMSKFWVAEALVEFTLKPNCLPCIPAKGVMEGQIVEDKDDDHDKWLDDSKGIVVLRFTNIDYITIQESYKFTVHHWMWSMHWAWKVHKEIAKFVNMNNEIKVKYSKLAKTVKISDPKYAEYLTKRNRAKIDNNAFYGKYGEDIIKEGKTPYLEDGEVIWRVDRREEQKEGKRKFLPVAMAITAWGRQQLVRMANILGEYLLYVDTDSVHYLREGQYRIDAAIKAGIVTMDAEKLGAWKHEANMDKGRYLRSKCYMEGNIIENEETGEKEWELEATVAGLPADPHTGQFSKKRSCLNWDNFRIGHVVPEEQANRLRTVKTLTGNKLIPTHFSIKEKESLFAS